MILPLTFISHLQDCFIGTGTIMVAMKLIRVTSHGRHDVSHHRQLSFVASNIKNIKENIEIPRY